MQHKPPGLLSFIQSFHDDMKGTVVFDGSTSDAFNIKSGVKQGCVLVPTLFGVFFALMLKHAFGSATEGIYLTTRSDQSSSTSQTNSNVQLECLREVMGQDVDSPPSISISDYELDGVHDFLYLGSTISDSLALNMEINKRIGKAATTMSSLTKRVRTNAKLT